MFGEIIPESSIDDGDEKMMLHEEDIYLTHLCLQINTH